MIELQMTSLSKHKAPTHKKPHKAAPHKTAAHRAKTKTNTRSQMLKQLMPILSGQIGIELGEALKSKNSAKVGTLMDQLKSELLQRLK